jgi:hypothetical protein
MAIKLKKKKNIIKGGKGFSTAKSQYRKPRKGSEDQYMVGEKVYDKGGVRKPKNTTAGVKVRYKATGERNRSTMADPNAPMRKRKRKYSSDVKVKGAR